MFFLIMLQIKRDAGIDVTTFNLFYALCIFRYVSLKTKEIIC